MTLELEVLLEEGLEVLLVEDLVVLFLVVEDLVELLHEPLQDRISTIFQRQR